MQKQTVEFGGVPVGIAVPHGDRLRFIAVKFHVIGLDNLQFSSMAELKVAIRDHVAAPVSLAA